MNTIFLKKNIIFALFLVIPVIVSGCNTMEGLGTDIKKGGQALERSADRNKPKETSKA